MPRIRKTEVEEAIAHIENALLANEMEGATFPAPGEFPFSQNALDASEMIKERTQDYREEWIAEPLRLALRILNEEVGRTEGQALALLPEGRREEAIAEALASEVELDRIREEMSESAARLGHPVEGKAHARAVKHPPEEAAPE